MIARRFLLLVTRLVLLVHDDESERLDRRKIAERAPITMRRAALTNLVPFIVTFADGQMRM